MDISLLCRVVDNYGDIGFVYRLARSLSEICAGRDLSLRLIVSNLESFSKMAPGVDSSKSVQSFCGWTVLEWNDAGTCLTEYKKNPPQVILECFQCGRPEWLDDLLFSADFKSRVQIVNVEYLTAEEWADDFHLLKSGTRSINVKKFNFMPGFTEKTGGLVLDADFIKSVSSKDAALARLVDFLKDGGNAEIALKMENALKSPSVFTAVVFAYSRNMDGIIEAFVRFQNMRRKGNPEFKVCLFVASGLSSEPVLESIGKLGSSLDFISLPYMRQEAWDALLCASDWNLIRGEDSFARACLSGNPFLWHAYVQDDEYQLVKVAAILRRIKEFFESESDFKKYADLMLVYNRNLDKPICGESLAAMNELSATDLPSSEGEKSRMESDLLFNLLQNSGKIKSTFTKFSSHLLSLGNLTEKLLSSLP